MAVWVIVGASRGIGLEWVRQLLARGDRVLASFRNPANASQLWSIAGAAGGRCELFECDIASELSIGVRAAPSWQNECSDSQLGLTKTRNSLRILRRPGSLTELTMLC